MPLRPTRAVGAFLPLVDPGEAVSPALARLPDRGGDGGGLQAIEPGLQALVVQRGIAATDEGQDLIGRRGHQARGAQATVARIDDLGGCPDQHVGVPDGRHAVLRRRLDADRHLAHPEVDRPDARRFGEGEERPGHQVLRVAQRHVAGSCPEQFELLVVDGAAHPTGPAQRARTGAERGGTVPVDAVLRARIGG